MDIYEAIRSLYEDRKRLDRLIALLEAKHAAAAADKPRKRGPQAMNTARRAEISERMKRYWAARKAETGVTPQADS